MNVSIFADADAAYAAGMITTEQHLLLTEGAQENVIYGRIVIGGEDGPEVETIYTRGKYSQLKANAAAFVAGVISEEQLMAQVLPGDDGDDDDGVRYEGWCCQFKRTPEGVLELVPV